MQETHHPNSRLRSRHWYSVSWQPRAKGCAQSSLHCFGYDTCTLERFSGRNPPPLRRDRIVSLSRFRLSRGKAYFGAVIEFLCGWQRFARDVTQNPIVSINTIYWLTAFRSLSTSRIFRHPELPGYLAGLSIMYSYSPLLSNMPSFTSLKLTISAPSSKIFTEVGGIDPGKIPPMSAWCPRDAVKNMISLDSG